MTVKIFTFAHKRPDFLEMQVRTFRDKVKGGYEFIVFNNASFDKDRTDYQQIHNWCIGNGVTCIDIENDPDLVSALEKNETVKIFSGPNHYTDSVIACSYPICWAWKHIISPTKDKICIIDSDMFFMKEFNIEAELDKYDLSYVPQDRGPTVLYMWNGIVFANLANLPEKESINWWCGRINNIPVDVGGQTHHYLAKYPDIKTLVLRPEHYHDDPRCNFHPSHYEFINREGRNDEHLILHYRSGSNWNNMPPHYHVEKTKWTKQLLGQS